MTNLNSSKSSGPDCIPVVVLKNCEPEISYILAELFNMCMMESCLMDCWKVSSMVPVLKNVGKRRGLLLKTITLLIYFLQLLKFLKKLVNNRIVDNLEICGLFSFPVWF